MSTLTAFALRTLAFGDLDAGVWGAAFGGAEPFMAIGTLHPDAAAVGASAGVGGSSAAEDWRLSSEHVELTVSPGSDPVAPAGMDGFDQLCRVKGHFVLDDAEHAVDCLGRRGSRADLDLRNFEAIRDISAWFGPDEGIALTALRPRGASGHGTDIVVASVFESDGAAEVADPRLSTTYDMGGLPVRAGLELWLDDEGEDGQYPRRAAGEALGAHAAAGGELDVHAQAFRWHSRGRDGAGVYLLARPK